jgi:hypothetical protein
MLIRAVYATTIFTKVNTHSAASGKIKRCDWTGRKYSKDSIDKMILSKKERD